MKSIIKTLNYYTKLYDEGHPQITDKEWDELYFLLQELEKSTGIIYPDSPTQKIHFETVSQLNKVTHNHPMLSLDKTKSIDEIKAFIHNQPFVAMFKMDGLTCSLMYQDGKLVGAETRGDGRVGEDILHNIKTVKNVPLEIPYKETIVIDGEIICRKDDFVPFQTEFKNPRNFASGSIRLLDANTCQKRNLTFIAWDLIQGYSDRTIFHWRLDTLKELGFTVVPYIANVNNINTAFDVIENTFNHEHEIYPIDGYVFKFDDIKYGKAQGQTDHHFKNAMALKLYDEIYETTLKDIEWSMGRTGVLTPVAIFEPIEIDGATVERASLSNFSILEEKLGKPYIGQRIWVCKKNQIIPYIEKAEKINV